MKTSSDDDRHAWRGRLGEDFKPEDDDDNSDDGENAE